ncbi:hypothetical protein R3W88_005298 [Solanum pinnatisectum]|uniref:RNase H type-1 domain-containing protein n=1 Tax=Solanum pinnatisectum TaxID=50273 RepID=A0AAV9KBN9_9SOLN|nr:hypothetical protein R3W88_005298 [Solanum pinnatisectum]
MTITLAWVPPQKGFIKLNTDGVLKPYIHTQGIGGVFHDFAGNLIIGFAGEVNNANIPLQTKALALLRGLQLAIAHYLTSLQINIDVKEVLQHIQNTSNSPMLIFYDCRHLLNHLKDPSFAHVYGEQNAVTEKMAHFGSSMNGGSIRIFNQPPIFVMDLLEAGQRGVTK